MRLAMFEVQTVLGQFQRLGVLLPGTDNLLLDLNTAYNWLLHQEGEPQSRRLADAILPPDLKQFLQLGPKALEEARRTLAFCLERNIAESLWLGLGGATLVFPMHEVVLKPPIQYPHMLRDFLAFETHTKAGYARRNEPVPEAWYKMPVYYKGNPYSLIGPDEVVLWPRYTRKLDYELELACVIGKEGRNIPVEKAHEYIAGYTILNDFSARDIQKYEMMCRLGPAKGKDFATALGPVLVTPDELPHPLNLNMQARINGELWSEGQSGSIHWTFEQMIAHVSQDETLYPGDIFGSGTVGSGCGLDLDRWLQPGDVIELEIEGLGVLKNTIGQNTH